MANRGHPTTSCMGVTPCRALVPSRGSRLRRAGPHLGANDDSPGTSGTAPARRVCLQIPDLICRARWHRPSADLFRSRLSSWELQGGSVVREYEPANTRLATSVLQGAQSMLGMPGVSVGRVAKAEQKWARAKVSFQTQTRHQHCISRLNLSIQIGTGSFAFVE